MLSFKSARFCWDSPPKPMHVFLNTLNTILDIKDKSSIVFYAGEQRSFSLHLKMTPMSFVYIF